jgi:POT family proton-dependent oligopeptide transporter
MLEGWGMSPESAWHFGFGAAAVGMFFGLVQYSRGRARIPAAGDRPLGINSPAEAAHARTLFFRAAGGFALLVAILAGLSTAGTRYAVGSHCGEHPPLRSDRRVFTWLFTAGQWTRRSGARGHPALPRATAWAVFEQAG